jgi:hypothetical protein
MRLNGGGQEERWTPRTVVSNAEGRYVAYGLAPGKQPVAARAEGHAVWSGAATIDAGASSTLDIHLSPRARRCADRRVARARHRAGGLRAADLPGVRVGRLVATRRRRRRARGLAVDRRGLDARLMDVRCRASDEGERGGHPPDVALRHHRSVRATRANRAALHRESRAGLALYRVYGDEDTPERWIAVR